MLNIVLECNDGYFEPAYLTILSIVRRTKEPCSFYILSGDFSEVKPTYTMFGKKHAKYIETMIKSFNPKNSIQIYDFKHIYNKYFSNLKLRKFWKKYWAPYVFLKLFIPFIPNINGKALHLDCDVLVNGDIKEIFAFNIDNIEMLGTRDLFTRYKKLKRYYNGGVLLFNTNLLRKNNTIEKVIGYILRKRPLLAEQDAISYCCNIKRFSTNDFRFNWQKDGIKNDTLIKHFWSFIRLKPSHRGIRPWQIDKVQNILKLHNWDEDYKIFLSERKKWKKT